MFLERVLLAFVAALSVACGRDSKPAPSRVEDSSSASASGSAPSRNVAPPKIPAPKRLATLPVSAYRTSIAMDDEAVYLMTSNAAYRLVEGEPTHGIQLDLGIGPVLTRTAFVFWSNGSIWSAPKQGGITRELAQFAHQPQYFVSSGEALAWVDQTEEGLYTIQTLDGRKSRVLSSSWGEIRALAMIGELVYFVQRPTDDSWRIGFVHLDGRAPEYTAARKGRAPSQLTGSDGIYYFELDTMRILKLSTDLSREEVQLKDLVCSPIHVHSRIYCGCVEGLFDVGKDTQKPRVLAYNRPGTITSVTSNSKAVAWTVDVGPDQLAVDTLSASEAEGQVPAP
jgi:hypothetical protein